MGKGRRRSGQAIIFSVAPHGHRARWEGVLSMSCHTSSTPVDIITATYQYFLPNWREKRDFKLLMPRYMLTLQKQVGFFYPKRTVINCEHYEREEKYESYIWNKCRNDLSWDLTWKVHPFSDPLIFRLPQSMLISWSFELGLLQAQHVENRQDSGLWGPSLGITDVQAVLSFFKRLLYFERVQLLQ